MSATPDSIQTLEVDVPTRVPVSQAETLKIGFITDLSGPYESVDGQAGAEMIRLAVSEAGNTVNGRRVEVLVADHKNDVQVARAVAKRWFEDGVATIFGGVNSDTSLAVAEEAQAQKKLYFVVGAGTTEHRRFSPIHVVQYGYTTQAHGRALAAGLTERKLKNFQVISSDVPFGRQLRDGAVAMLKQQGVNVSSEFHHPYGYNEFEQLTAKMSHSDAVIFANSHTDFVESYRSIKRNGKTEACAAVFALIDDLHALGGEDAQGLLLVDTWFWSKDGETRDWSARFFERFGRMPTSLHAADYSAVKQYLAAVRAAESTEASAVLARLQRTKINDLFMANGLLRSDGVLIHDMYFLRAKHPSTQPWDYYELIKIIPAEIAFQAQTAS